MTDALLGCVEALAEDLGRLTRVAVHSGEYGCFLAECVCQRVEVLAGMIGPTAAEVCLALVLLGLEEDEAAREALAEGDRWRASLRERMRLDEDGHLCPRGVA